MRDALADRFVVAVKFLLDAVEAERRDRVIRGCCSFDQPVFPGGVAWTG